MLKRVSVVQSSLSMNGQTKTLKTDGKDIRIWMIHKGDTKNLYRGVMSSSFSAGDLLSAGLQGALQRARAIVHDAKGLEEAPELWDEQDFSHQGERAEDAFDDFLDAGRKQVWNRAQSKSEIPDLDPF